MNGFISPGSSGRESAPSSSQKYQSRLTSAATALVGLALLAPAGALLATPTPSPLSRLPLFFEPNRGQAASNVQYLARSQSGTFLLGSTGAVVTLPAKLANEASDAFPLAPRPSGPVPVHTLSLSFLGANPQATLSGAGSLPGKVNYFQGQDPARWRTEIPTFEKVQAAGVYPGIDLVYYGNQQHLEYDFVLAPGADPGRIAFRVAGADQLRIDEHGDLVLQVGASELRQHAPVLHQVINGTNQPVSGGYRLKDAQTVAFEVGRYDSRYPLVIDPTLSYATYFGGTANDSALAVAVDGAGNVYVAGQSLSAQLPATTNAFQPRFAGDSTAQGGDAFVAKFNSTGSSLLYLTYLGGSGFEEALGLAVDAAGNAYVTGVTDSKDFPLQSPLRSALTGTPTLNLGLLPFDAFVTKLNPAGSGLVYSTYLGGDDEDQGLGIAVDGAGNAYVTGFTRSSNFPTFHAIQTNLVSAPDVFVSEINSNGTGFVYSTYLGGSDLDEAGGIAVDAAGNAFVAGLTQSLNYPTTLNAFQHFLAGGQDAFVTEVAPGGTGLVYSTYLGGSANDLAYRVAVDGAGNAYVAGTESSGNAAAVPFPITPGNLSPGGVFVSSDAGLSWTAASAGLQSSVILSLAADPSSSTLYAGTSRGLARSTDGGGTWTTTVSVPGATNGIIPQLAISHVRALAIDPVNPANVYAGTDGQLYKSVNRGATWTLVLDNSAAGIPVRAIAINPQNPAVVYAGTSVGVYKSTNGTAPWTLMNNGMGLVDVRGVTVHPTAPNTVYAATANGVFRSTDAGGTWTTMTNGLNNLSTLTLAIDPVTPTTFYLGSSTGFYKSRNSGTNWSLLSGLLQAAPASTNNLAVSTIAVVPPSIYAGTTFGLFQTTDGGYTWANASNGLAGVSVRALAVGPASQLYAGTLAFQSLAISSAFATKFDAVTHGIDYSTAFGNSGTNQGFAVAADSAGNAYLVGTTDSGNYTVTNFSGFLTATNNGAHDAFITALNADASALLYSAYLGGSRDDFAFAVAVNGAGDAYVVGQTASTNFPVVAAFQPALAGGTDAFLAAILADRPAIAAAIVGNNLQLRWHAAIPNYVLETAPTAGAASAAWSVVPQTPVVSNGWSTVTLPAGSSAGIFRLHRR